MSPYLFIMCVEYLSRKMMEAQKRGSWKGCKAGRSGPKIDHLFFADDLLFIGEATTSNAYCLRNILEGFCERSGEIISEEK